MHFFKSVAAIATLAFGASSVVAAPLSNVGGVPIPPLPPVPRADAVSSVPQIIAAVTEQLTPLVAELSKLLSRFQFKE